MDNQRSKRIVKIVLMQLLVASLIFIMASLLVFFSLGYRFNFKSMRIIKTGILVLLTDQKPDMIVIGDIEETDPGKDFYIQLTPGYYDVSIRKEGYVTWGMTLKVEAEKVKEIYNIKLFKKNITLQTLTDQTKINLLNAPISTLATDDGLYFSKHEIWVSDNLVTRVSDEIKQAIWYRDKNHIIFQAGNQIRIVDSAGTNNTLLLNLKDENTARFVVNNQGNELYLSQNGEYKVASIK